MGPPLNRQSWKVSLLNYFLAALTGGCVGSLGLALLETIRGASSIGHAIATLTLGTAIYLVLSLPHVLVGLLPVAIVGELLARRTILPILVVTAIVASVSVPVALWLMPGVGLSHRDAVGIFFGLSATLAWAALSFRSDGLAASLQATNHA